jgi:hypothetical protein
MRTTYLVENTLFTTDLAENRVLFTSATSFTLKRRALMSSSAGPNQQFCLVQGFSLGRGSYLDPSSLAHQVRM